MSRRPIIQIGLALTLATSISTADPNTTIPEQYRVAPPQWPDTDRSAQVGQRILKLLSLQVAGDLRWIQQERAASGVDADHFVIRGAPVKNVLRAYDLCQTATCLCAMAVLARCGEPGKTMAGTTREDLEHTAGALLRAIIDTHPVGGGPNPHEDWWINFWGMRLQYLFGTGAWLLWDKLDAHTQLRVARVLEHDADLFLNKPAPARLRHDTQAESNAWNGGGMAVVACMLKHHPHRTAWADKAKELMLSAFATPADVINSRIVDGKPLNQWLTGPNALPDYTVENHGFIHPDYSAAASEMVRSAIAFRLAGEPIPEAATFNADKTLDALLRMTLPAGHYLYVQGTDYCARRLDSLFQACSVIPHKPDPLRSACFLRSLASIEKMATERPDLPMSGWLGVPVQFGMIWGLTENYMMRRLFGSGGEALPDKQVEQRLAGAHISEEGMFAIHRTPTTISSFSWRTSPRASRVMGLTMPLHLDALVYPMPGSLVGQLHEIPADTNTLRNDTPQVRFHRADARDNSLSVLLELERCAGEVAQNCAFVSLPDGTSVYIEERTAEKTVVLAGATSGNIVINDDLQWVYQAKPRRFVGQSGELAPSAATLYRTNWVNVDDRQGYVMLGDAPVRLTKVDGQPGIWRRAGTMYDTCHLEWVQLPSQDKPDAPVRFDVGQRVSIAALITLPNATVDQTKSLADEIKQAGWHTDEAGCLALRIGTSLVYANFSALDRPITAANAKNLPPRTCGWVIVP